jgi:transposase
MTKNINGYEYIGSNHYDRNRNGNKISIVVTKMGIPIGLKLEPSNIHDVNIVNDTIDNIAIKIVGSKIGGDKGYISSELKNNLKKIKILI